MENGILNEGNGDLKMYSPMLDMIANSIPMKEPIKLLEYCKHLNIFNNNKVLTNNRNGGNTTRMVDIAIQLLFKGYTVVVESHYEEVGERSMTAHKISILDRIVGRLKQEHRIGVRQGVTFSKNQNHTLTNIGNDPYTIKLVEPIDIDKSK